MSYEQASRLSVLGWNIKAGGFDAHDPTLPTPSRETDIINTISSFRTGKTPSAVSLGDAYRWDTTYGGDEGIAQHLGYPEARYVALDDERLRKSGQDDIGVVFATDQRIHTSNTLDLDTRQGLRTVLDIGEDGLQIASVYLDDFSEETRIRQIHALVAGLEKEVPTIIVGDLNSLRPTMKGASLRVKAGNLAVRALAFSLPSRTYLGSTINGMNKRQAIPLLESFGYTDADAANKRPTAPAILPIFGIDYALHNRLAKVDNLQVLPSRRASDHCPLTFDVSPVSNTQNSSETQADQITA